MLLELCDMTLESLIRRRSEQSASQSIQTQALPCTLAILEMILMITMKTAAAAAADNDFGGDDFDHPIGGALINAGFHFL